MRLNLLLAENVPLTKVSTIVKIESFIIVVDRLFVVRKG